MSSANVFISYARKDGAELAHRLLSDLQRCGFEVWLDTREIGGGAIWTKEIEQALDQSEVVLALLTTGSYVSEICRAEQLRALRHNKCVIPLRAQAGGEIVPLHLEAKNYRDLVASYDSAFAALVTDIERREGVMLQDRYRETYVTAPLLPDTYVERPEALQALRHAIFTEGGGRNIALTALQGMGGVGKSVLAAALCHDEVVQQAFPDGVVWVTAGKEATDLVMKMREVAKGFGDDLSRYDNELGCRNQYRSAMLKKAALVVVDDVWDARDLEPFRAESPRSRLLFTTRSAEVAAALGAHEHSVGLLTEMQSRELLATGSGMHADKLPLDAEELIHECGCLPLAVGMIGAMLRNKPITLWRRVLEHLRSADLAKIKAQFPDYPHTDLLRTIQVSVDALDAIARQRYLALAVLLEDMPVHPAIQRSLWDVNAAEAEETAELFVGLSLAQREGESIRIHDLQLDFCRAHFQDRASLALIREALHLSHDVIAKDPLQFASQIVGRLLPHRKQSAISEFIARIAGGAPRPWLKLLHPSLHPPGTTLMRIMEGHSGYVPWNSANSGGVAHGFRFMGRKQRVLDSDTNVFHGVALNPDGRCAILAWDDKTLKVCDLDSGRVIRTLKGHSDHVTGVVTTADGRLAVSASYDKTLKVWDIDSGHNLRTLEGHSASVNEVAVTPDGRCAISASSDWTLKVWELDSGRELRTLRGTPEPITGVAITPDGRRAVSTSSDWTPTVWDLISGRVLRFLAGHTDDVTGIAVTPDGRRAISASQDKTLKVWDLDSGRELRTLKGHTSGVNGLAVALDGRRAVSASRDGTLKVWDLDSGFAVLTLEGHSDHVTSVAVSPDGWRAVSASRDKTLKVWDLDSGRELNMLEGHSGFVNAVAVTPIGRRAVSASGDGTLKVWDIDSGRALHTLEGHSNSVDGLAVTPDGRRAVSASRDTTLKVWTLDSGSFLRTLHGHTERVNGVAITPDGQLAVSWSWDTTLRIWDIDSGRALHTLTGHSNYVYGVAITPDGRRAVSASRDKTLKVWDINSGRIIHTLKGHSDWVYEVVVTPDGQRALSASEDKTVKVWELISGREVCTLIGHSDAVNRLVVTPNNRRAVSASQDGILMVWDLDSGRELCTLRGHSSSISGIMVTSDGRRAVSASNDKTLRVLGPRLRGPVSDVYL
jgi:WD40 repeat protein